MKFYKRTNIHLHALYHLNSAKANELLKAPICFLLSAHLQVYYLVRINSE